MDIGIEEDIVVEEVSTSPPKFERAKRATAVKALKSIVASSIDDENEEGDQVKKNHN